MQEESGGHSVVVLEYVKISKETSYDEVEGFFVDRKIIERVFKLRLSAGKVVNLPVVRRLEHSAVLYVGVAGDVIIVLGLSSRRCRVKLSFRLPDKTEIECRFSQLIECWHV